MLLLDASYFIALADGKDRWHRHAVDLVPFVQKHGHNRTHALVLAEVVAVIGSGHGGKAARAVYAAMRDECDVTVPTLAEMDAAMTTVLRYDGAVSLADAVSLDLMKRQGIKRVVSFDSDFDGKGVERIHAVPR